MQSTEDSDAEEDLRENFSIENLKLKTKAKEVSRWNMDETLTMVRYGQGNWKVVEKYNDDDFSFNLASEDMKAFDEWRIEKSWRLVWKKKVFFEKITI